MTTSKRAIDDLRNPPAVRQGVQRLGDRGRREAMKCRTIVIDLNPHLRNEDLLFDLEID